MAKPPVPSYRLHHFSDCNLYFDPPKTPNIIMEYADAVRPSGSGILPMPATEKAAGSGSETGLEPDAPSLHVSLPKPMAFAVNQEVRTLFSAPWEPQPLALGEAGRVIAIEDDGDITVEFQHGLRSKVGLDEISPLDQYEDRLAASLCIVGEAPSELYKGLWGRYARRNGPWQHRPPWQHSDCHAYVQVGGWGALWYSEQSRSWCLGLQDELGSDLCNLMAVSDSTQPDHATVNASWQVHADGVWRRVPNMCALTGAKGLEALALQKAGLLPSSSLVSTPAAQASESTQANEPARSTRKIQVIVQGTPAELGSQLYGASYNGDAGLAKILIVLKADVGWRHPDAGSTPLHVAAERGHANVLEHLLPHLRDGQIEQTRADGTTALSLACTYRKLAAVNLLLAAHANVEDGSRTDVASSAMTPLWCACHHGDVELARVLLNHGANPMAQCGDWGALDLARRSGNQELLELMLKPPPPPIDPMDDADAQTAGLLTSGDIRLLSVRWLLTRPAGWIKRAIRTNSRANQRRRALREAVVPVKV